MPSTQVVQVVVEKLNKFGFYDQTGGVYYSKNLKDADKLKVVPGAKFNAEYYVADSGSRYLNKVFDMLVTTEQVKKETKFSTHKDKHPFVTNPEDFKSQPIPAPETTHPQAINDINNALDKYEEKAIQLAKGTKSVTSDTMTRADWDNKDRRISRQGCIQAAVQALTGVYPTVTELYDGAEELALKMLDFVNEVK